MIKSGLDYLNQDTCPVSGLPVTRKDHWTDIDLGEGFFVTFALIGDFILVNAPKGNPGLNGNLRIYEEREKVLKELELWDKYYVELKDYAAFSGRATRSSRMQFTEGLLKERDRGNLRGYWAFNAPVFIRMSFNIGTKLHKHNVPVLCLKTYDEAIRAAIETLKAEGLMSGESSLKEEIQSLRKWELVTTKAGLKILQIREDVIYHEAWGEFSEDFTRRAIELHERAQMESGVSELGTYYRITNWSGLTKTRWASRRIYIEGMRRMNKLVPCSMICIFGLNKFMTSMMRLTAPFTAIPLIPVKDFQDGLRVIEQDKKRRWFKKTGAGKRFGVLGYLDAKKVEKEVNELVRFIGGINWDSVGMEESSKASELFRPLYESLTIVKHDFDTALREKEELQKKFLLSARMASIGELAAGVGHEINNPLMIIKGYVTFLQQELSEELGEENLHMLKQIDLATSRIANIVKGLRMLARTDDNIVENVDLHSAIEDVIGLTGNLYERDGISVTMNLDARMPFFRGNAGKVQQILINMLSNSADALKNKDKKEICVSTKIRDGNVVLEIFDTGVGISKEIQDRIFDSFFTTKEVGHGTGLGLGIVSSFVRGMFGKINVESEPGEWTRFILSFPSIKMEGMIVDDLDESDENMILKGRALVVDDESEICFLLKNLLRQIGVESDVAGNGEEALNLYEENDYDFVITDLKMPVMNGYEFLEKIRDNKDKSVGRVLAISGEVFNDERLKSISQEYNINGFIQKPFSKTELYQKLK